MATHYRDPREQARVLGEHGLARHQLEALHRLGPDLRLALESLPPHVALDVTDALLGLLAGDRLWPEQRAALVAPLLAQLQADPAAAPAERPLLVAVPS